MGAKRARMKAYLSLEFRQFLLILLNLALQRLPFSLFCLHFTTRKTGVVFDRLQFAPSRARSNLGLDDLFPHILQPDRSQILCSDKRKKGNDCEDSEKHNFPRCDGPRCNAGRRNPEDSCPISFAGAEICHEADIWICRNKYRYRNQGCQAEKKLGFKADVETVHYRLPLHPLFATFRDRFAMACGFCADVSSTERDL